MKSSGVVKNNHIVYIFNFVRLQVSFSSVKVEEKTFWGTEDSPDTVANCKIFEFYPASGALTAIDSSMALAVRPFNGNRSQFI